MNKLLDVIQDALIKAIGKADSELINALSSAYQRVATSSKE